MIPAVKEFDLLTRGLVDWRGRYDLSRQEFEKLKEELRRDVINTIKSLDTELRSRATVIRKIRLLELALTRNRERMSLFISSNADKMERVRQAHKSRLYTSPEFYHQQRDLSSHAAEILNDLYKISIEFCNLLTEKSGCVSVTPVTKKEHTWQFLLPIRPLSDDACKSTAEGDTSNFYQVPEKASIGDEFVVPWANIRLWTPPAEGKSTKFAGLNLIPSNGDSHLISGSDEKARYTLWVDSLERQSRFLSDLNILVELAGDDNSQTTSNNNNTLNSNNANNKNHQKKDKKSHDEHSEKRKDNNEGAITENKEDSNINKIHSLQTSYFKCLKTLRDLICHGVILNIPLYIKSAISTLRTAPACEGRPFSRLSEEIRLKTLKHWGFTNPHHAQPDLVQIKIDQMVEHFKKLDQIDELTDNTDSLTNPPPPAANPICEVKTLKGPKWWHTLEHKGKFPILACGGQIPVWKRAIRIREQLASVRAVRISAGQSFVFSGGDEWSLRVTDLKSYLPHVQQSLSTGMLSGLSGLVTECVKNGNEVVQSNLSAFTLSGHLGPILDIIDDPVSMREAELGVLSVIEEVQQQNSQRTSPEDQRIAVSEGASTIKPGLVFSASADATVRAWRVPPRGALIEATRTTKQSYAVSHAATFRGHRDAVWSIDLHCGLPVLLSGSADGTMRLWPAKLETPEADGPIDGEDMSSVTIYGSRQEREISEKEVQNDSEFAIAAARFLPCEPRVFAAGIAKSSIVQLWDMERGDVYNRTETPYLIGDSITNSSYLTALTCHHTLPLIATGHENGTVLLWDARDVRRPVSRFLEPCPDGFIASQSFDPEGFFLAATHGNGMLSYIDIRAGVRMQQVTVSHTMRGEGALGLSHAAGLMAVGCSGGDVVLLEAAHRVPPPKFLLNITTVEERQLITKIQEGAK